MVTLQGGDLTRRLQFCRESTDAESLLGTLSCRMLSEHCAGFIAGFSLLSPHK